MFPSARRYSITYSQFQLNWPPNYRREEKKNGQPKSASGARKEGVNDDLVVHKIAAFIITHQASAKSDR